MVSNKKGRQEYFNISKTKLENLIKEKGMSESSVSVAIGYSRGWLYKAKKSGRVNLEDAQRIADVLGCAIQKFGSGEYWNPVCFDYDSIAQSLFGALLERGKNRELVEVLGFMEADDSSIDYLCALISSKAQIQRKKDDSDDDESISWTKMLYVSIVARTLANRLSVDDQDVFDTIAKKRAEIEKGSEIVELKEKLKTVKKIDNAGVQTEKNKPEARIGLEKKLAAERARVKGEVMEEIERIVKNKYIDKADGIEISKKLSEAIKKECSDFLYSYFTSRANDLSIDAKVELYKRGELF